MRLFTPETYVNSALEITPGWMAGKNLEALLVDLDDTLSPHGQLEPSDEVIGWVRSLTGEGYRLIAFSNNHEERVAPFAKTLGIPYVFSAGKPLPALYSKAVKTLGLPKKKVAMVGDQIFTDILGANLAGIRSVLVLSGHKSQYGFTRFKRKIEKQIIKGLERRAGA
jgi:HAD superfamily phosphatase (TIGR01668 family)